jgi:tRNA nucleotidyltransferase/poly(A) polymerase
LNADAMNAAQIHDAINAGMNDLREGKVQNAHTAFAAFREAHK